MSQTTIEILLDILEIDGGLLRYDQLLQGGIPRKVARYFQQYDSEIINNKNPKYIAGKTSCDDESALLQPEKNKKCPSSMDGKNGVLADEYKQEELRQYTSLLDFCNGKGITLDWKLAEKGIEINIVFYRCVFMKLE